jgi:glycosyltransferase involved in cell wall biosynthesis
MSWKNHTVSVFLPALEGGGAERVMLHLADGFAQRGFKTDLVIAEAFGDYLGQVPASVRLVDLESTFPVILSKTMALRRYLKQEKPIVLLSALDILGASFWARWRTQVPTRIVMCVQTYLSSQFQYDPFPPNAWLRSTMVRWLYPKADALIAASYGTAADLAQWTALPLEQIRVIYNPVITPEVLKKSQEPIDHPWFAPGEPPVILGVGRLVMQKDFFTLIQAFAQVRQKIPARLMILGEGEQRAQLEDLIQALDLKEGVALPGFVENPYAYMRAVSVFVLSSRYEGFGNVVAEALAMGTPVVSTDCPSGPSEILARGKYGKLVPMADATAMADAILETLTHPTPSETLKHRSLDFECDRIVDQYLDVVEQLMEAD